MKLPEDLEEKLDTIRWRIDIGNEATRLACFEAIVRDCTNAFIRLLGDSPQAKRAAIAVLHRYGLVAEQNTLRADAWKLKQEEYGWLIESQFDHVGPPRWWGCRKGINEAWTTDPNSVVRFCRKEDAELAMRIADIHMGIATDHIWLNAAIEVPAEPNAAAPQHPDRTVSASPVCAGNSASAAAPCIAGQFASGLKTWATKP